MPQGTPASQTGLAEVEKALAAITRGSADAVMIESEAGPRLVELGSSALTRFMIQRMPVGAATIDRDGIVLYCNPELARIAGESLGAIGGRPFRELVHPDDHELIAGWFGEAPGDRSRVKLRIGAAGRWTAALLDFRLLDPRLPGVGALIAADVSTQEQAEAKSRLRGELLDTVDAAVIATDLEGCVREWNAGAEALYDYSPEEALGTNIMELTVGPADQSVAAEIVEQVQSTGSWSGRFDAMRQDGSCFPVFVRNTLTHDGAGRPTGVVGVSVDISEQLEIEQDAIAAREYMLAVTDQLLDGLISVDEENSLTYMNSAAQQILGFVAADLEGRNKHDVLHDVHADGTAHRIEECPISAVRAGLKRTHSEDNDVFRRKDGSLVAVSYSAAGFETPAGGRGVSVVFRDISQEVAERDRIRGELETISWVGPIRKALERDSMVLYSQPIEDIGSREVVQQELLLRMVGDGGDVIAAGQFMPAAEQYNMVKEIDRWIIPRAIATAAELGQPIQFNLSAASIQDPSTPQLIEDEIAASGVDPRNIVVEVTESGLVDHYLVAQRFANRLVYYGCQIALDDFGTGYGGFTYLTKLPVSILKIDISFIHDLTVNSASRKVVKAVVGLAREFGQTTVAEGVEDAETLELLAELGVDQAQGYHLGRPGPLDLSGADSSAGRAEGRDRDEEAAANPEHAAGRK